jgi:hypothetical protein
MAGTRPRTGLIAALDLVARCVQHGDTQAATLPATRGRSDRLRALPTVRGTQPAQRGRLRDSLSGYGEGTP